MTGKPKIQRRNKGILFIANYMKKGELTKLNVNIECVVKIKM